MYDLNFREATPKDWKDIIEIHNSHAIRDENPLNTRGFLLAKTAEKEIQENLGAQTQYFVAENVNSELQSEILGFLALSKPKISEEFLNSMLWKDDAYRHQILGENHLDIKTVTTHPNHGGKAVGQFLYRSLYETFPNAFLSAFIATKPLTNRRSIIFHQKQGFHHVATRQRESFLDFKNYESILMVKKIQSNRIRAVRESYIAVLAPCEVQNFMQKALLQEALAKSLTRPNFYNCSLFIYTVLGFPVGEMTH